MTWFAAARKNYGQLESQQPEIEALISHGDSIDVLLRESGVLKSTKQANSIRGVQWFTFQNGKIKKIDQIAASIWKLLTEDDGPHPGEARCMSGRLSRLPFPCRLLPRPLFLHCDRQRLSSRCSQAAFLDWRELWRAPPWVPRPRTEVIYRISRTRFGDREAAFRGSREVGTQDRHADQRLV